MDAGVLIVGQGLAGSLVGWELEQAGVRFVIADPGHAGAASAVAAGLVNPVTGRRLVPVWRVAQLLPQARRTYREIGDTFGVPLWHDVRIRRRFADDQERAWCVAKLAGGALAPYIHECDADGCWIEGAGRVDLPRLLQTLREHWRGRGGLWEEAVDPFAELGRWRRVIDCRGLAGACDRRLGEVPWEFSKGEVLRIEAGELEPGVVLNQRHWVAPVDSRAAWVGATHEPGRRDLTLTSSARAALEASATRLLGRSYTVTCHLAGVRVNIPDKLPVAGMCHAEPRLGVCNGLGGKGTLWAPMLARIWGRRAQAMAGFLPEWDSGRFHENRQR